jgi:hypothetical protein
MWHNLNQRWAFAVWAVAYACVVAWYAPTHWANFDNDGMAYWSLAQHLLHGREYFLNGYWSPLHAVLLVPFTQLGLQPWYAGHLCLALEGLFALWACWRVLRALPWPPAFQWLLLPILVLFVGTASSWIITPHVLSAGLVLWAVSMVLHPDYPARRRLLWQLALVCALAYWARAYNALALAGFLVAYHGGVVLAHRFQRSALRVHGRAVLIGLGGIGIAIGVWAGAVALRTGEFHPLGTAGPYNQALAYPWYGQQPHLHMGLNLPPNPWAVNMFEDVLSYPNLPHIPTDAEVNWAAIAAVNADRMGYWLPNSGLLWVLGLVLCWCGVFAALLVRRKLNHDTWEPSENPWKAVGWLAVFPVLYTLGYLFAFFEDRYVYPATWLLAIGGVFGAWWCLAHVRVAPLFRYTVIALVVAFYSTKLSLWPRFMLDSESRNYAPFHLAAESMNAAQLRLAGARWSSLPNPKGIAGVIMSFLTNGRYCNEPLPAHPDTTIRQWQRFGIQYVAVYGADSLLLPQLVQVEDLRVYAVPPLHDTLR